ncbi:PIN domain-containing protein [candidate division KSB1 bacterium]|nr:PIN domain-containing protein [candidate division KSB1 bacterium]
MIYWLNAKFPQINDKIKNIDNKLLFISSITVAELYYGAYNSSKQKENIKLLKRLIFELNIINFDPKAGEVFGKIKVMLKKYGKIINDSDIFIASTAVSNNLTLVTNNEKHFQRIDDLKVENWAK